MWLGGGRGPRVSVRGMEPAVLWYRYRCIVVGVGCPKVCTSMQGKGVPKPLCRLRGKVPPRCVPPVTSRKESLETLWNGRTIRRRSGVFRPQLIACKMSLVIPNT